MLVKKKNQKLINHGKEKTRKSVKLIFLVFLDDRNKSKSFGQ